MSNTHILVPINRIDHARSVIRLAALGREMTEFEKAQYDYLTDILNSDPKVDLSEEGIEKQATSLYGKNIYSIDEVEAYKQCAKDLLNTKP